MPSDLFTSKPLASSNCVVISAIRSCSVKFLPPTVISAEAADTESPNAATPVSILFIYRIMS